MVKCLHITWQQICQKVVPTTRHWKTSPITSSCGTQQNLASASDFVFLGLGQSTTLRRYKTSKTTFKNTCAILGKNQKKKHLASLLELGEQNTPSQAPPNRSRTSPGRAKSPGASSRQRLSHQRTSGATRDKKHLIGLPWGIGCSCSLGDRMKDCQEHI